MRIAAFVTDGERYLLMASRENHYRYLPEVLQRAEEKAEDAAARAAEEAGCVAGGFKYVTTVGDIALYRAQVQQLAVPYNGQGDYPVYMSRHDNILREPTREETPWLVALGLKHPGVA